MNISTLCLGLMSGTSMDGVDAALIRTNGVEETIPIANCSISYPLVFQRVLKLSERIMQKLAGDIAKAHQDFLKLCKEILFQEWNYEQQHYDHFWQDLGGFLAELNLQEINFANIIKASTLMHVKVAQQLIKKAKIKPEDIELIGYHGQTLYHNPQQHITLQVGDAQLLANLLHINVIGQLRLNDVKHGGQGAPLAPIYHWAIAKQHNLTPTAVFNCGGIANVTFVPHKDPCQLVAFDCGPGNVLLDRIIRTSTQEKLMYDKDGQFALQGRCNTDAFEALFRSALPTHYLTQTPPKSLDSKDFQLPKQFDTLNLEDACATLAAFTAQCMVDAFEFCETQPVCIIVAGGGWRNPAIFAEFKRRLHQKFNTDIPIIDIKKAQHLGWQEDALEAEAFAYLAKRSSLGLPLSFPGTTGIAKPISGGQFFKPQTNS